MSAAGIELVVVDFDDTLVDTAPRFQNARRGLFAYLESRGVAASELARTHHERVDAGLIERHGLGPGRFEHSFRATYQELCRHRGRVEDEEEATHCAMLGRSVFGTPPAFDGAVEALARLAGRYPTVLYTQAADAEYQHGCIRAAGVLDILGAEAIEISPRKTAAAFRELIEKRGASAGGTWMVGNSIRSDINPALESGANAILIESADPWSFDVVDPISEEFWRQPCFAAAVDFLLGLELEGR